MKPTTFRMRNKQRLMALMIAGTVVGLGYQADIAQADTTAVESGGFDRSVIDHINSDR